MGMPPWTAAARQPAVSAANAQWGKAVLLMVMRLRTVG